MSMTDEGIGLEATIGDDGLPSVAVTFEAHTEIMPVVEARNFAIALFNAAAIAENEVAVFNGFEGRGKPKGFAKPALKAYSIPVMAVQLMREFRPKFGYGITAFRGFNTGEAIVAFPWPSRSKGLQFDLNGARTHARQLMECAEAAETDAFLRHFMQWKIQSSPDEAQSMVMEFREFRTRLALENLLK
jgi:hypothetical protein